MKTDTCFAGTHSSCIDSDNRPIYYCGVCNRKIELSELVYTIDDNIESALASVPADRL